MSVKSKHLYYDPLTGEVLAQIGDDLTPNVVEALDARHAITRLEGRSGSMFWLCYEVFRGSKRLSRAWIVEADGSPDEPDENGERPYPFNGMGGYVEDSYAQYKDAAEAKYELEGRMLGLGTQIPEDLVPEDPSEPHTEMVGDEVVGGEVKVLFPDGTERMCRVGPTTCGNTLIWIPVYGTWLKMWKSQTLLQEIVSKGEVLLAESSFDPRLHRRCKVD